MNDTPIKDLLPFYALGALSEAEKTAVDAYLRQHPEARAELEDLKAAAALLPLENEAVRPSATVKQNLMRRVAANPRRHTVAMPPQPSRSWWRSLQEAWRSGWARPALTSGALALAVLLFIWSLALNRQVNQLQQQLAAASSSVAAISDELAQQTAETAVLQDELALSHSEIRRLNEQLAAQEAILAIYQAPDTRRFVAAAADSNGVAQLTANLAAQTAVLSTANLDQLPVDSVYQLWLLNPDSAPVSGGVFTIDAGGATTVLLPNLATTDFEAIAVSIEPAGGSEQPTGPIVLTP